MENNARSSRGKLTALGKNLQANLKRCEAVQTQLGYYTMLYENACADDEKPDPHRAVKKIYEIYHRNDNAEKHLKDDERHRQASWCCDEFVPPRYEQPTIASKAKTNKRSSNYSRLYSRSLPLPPPFVVGTSLAPGYNVGLNIQQIMSRVKHRQLLARPVTEMKTTTGAKTNALILREKVLKRLCNEFEDLQCKFKNIGVINDEKLVDEIETNLNTKAEEVETMIQLISEVDLLKQQLYQRYPKHYQLTGILRQIQHQLGPL